MSDSDFDLVVVGSGAAGLSAAVAATMAGARVLVLEKTEWLGGTSALSGGEIWVPMSAQARRAGVPDSVDAVERYLRALVGPLYDAERTRAFLDAAPRVLAELERCTPLRYELMSLSPDYHSELPGACPGGRSLAVVPFDGRTLGSWFDLLRPPLRNALIFGGTSVCTRLDLPHLIAAGRRPGSAAYAARLIVAGWLDRLAGFRRGTRLTNGNAMVGCLLRALRERSVPIWTQAEVSTLHMVDARVCAVGLRQGGGYRRVSARQGVVLATGGFSGSLEKKQHHFKHVAAGATHHSLPPPGNTGDGAEMAISVGACMPEPAMRPAAWAPVSMLPVAHGDAAPWPHFSIDKGKPGIIAVNEQGERFVNESESYHEFVTMMLARSMKQAYLVADHRALRRYGLGVARPYPSPLYGYLRSGYLVRGRDLRELAAKLGIDGQRLQRTVHAFNESALRGEDPDFGRGHSLFDRRGGDADHRPNPALGPLIKPPFYAVRVQPGDIGTFLGLLTDGHARVLDRSGMPIPGLYAAGNEALSLFGGHYPAAGITLGPALTFGWLAAQNALSSTTSSNPSKPLHHDEAGLVACTA